MADSRKGPLESKPVAICYTEGVYPPPAGETCEQWRAEGRPEEIPVSEVLETAPIGSFAQILAVGRRKPGVGRMALRDREQFIEEVKQVKEQFEAGNVDMNELEACVRVVRLVPERIELLISGPIWERFQWTREAGKWTQSTRLLPY